MNKIKQVWAKGEVVVNGWLVPPSSFTAEVFAQCGFDSVTVDMQHGIQDYMSTVQCFQAMGSCEATPMVRVPWNEPGIIGKALDAGASGLICPMINTVEEARALVSYCKYPPLGMRSNGPIRHGMYSSPGNYQKTANREIIVLPMIESKVAVHNIDEILDVEGIDGVYVGPSDLGFSYGLEPKLDYEETRILKIFEEIVEGCEKRKIYPRIHCGGTESAARAIDMGFKFVTVTDEVSLISKYGRVLVDLTRASSRGSA